MLQARSICHAIKILIANALRLRRQNATAFFHHFLTYFASNVCEVWIFDKQCKNKIIKNFCKRKITRKEWEKKCGVTKKEWIFDPERNNAYEQRLSRDRFSRARSRWRGEDSRGEKWSTKMWTMSRTVQSKKLQRLDVVIEIAIGIDCWNHG